MTMTFAGQLRYDLQTDGILIHFVNGWIKLTPYSDRIIRVRYTQSHNFSTAESLIVEKKDQQKVEFSVNEDAEKIEFSTAEISILIRRDTAAFTYLNKSGALLAKEPDRGGKTLTPVEVVKSVFDESIRIYADESADGLRTRIEGAKKVVDRTAYHTKLEFEWADDEALYGLGSHEEGMFNLRGQHQYLYQQNMKSVIPILVSTKGYGILFDSCSLMEFHDDAEGSFLWSDVDDELDYYFVFGPELDQIVHGIRRLTGKAPMLPKWAFGYMQSKERYKSQDELIDIVKEFRQRNLPLDCIVLDWHYWPDGLWGQKSFDPACFPDPKLMMETIHRLNARLMISIWPIMNPDGDDWKEMQKHGLLLGNQATYDAFRPQAQQLYWDQANRGLFAHGIDAWWCDCAEPFESDWKGIEKPEPTERLRINTEEAKLYLDPEYINAYSLHHSRGIYEGQRKVTNDKRVVNLIRSAYAGQHRYATITWSGDISATWETLRTQIPEGLNFCASGSPYWTLDIGGFFVKNRPDLWFWSGDYDDGLDDLGFRELYVRWFQYGAFLPIFRSHGTDIAREIWQFGEPGDPFYEALVKFIHLRYRLMPYIYSLAGMVTHEDYTMMRALPFDFRDDPNTYNIKDQFMFGPAIMVNPVTHPMYFSAGSKPLDNVAKIRPVYLPKGCDWYDFWTGKRYSGGQTIAAESGLDIIPIFVRAGSIIPLGPDIQYVNEKPDAPLKLQIYPGRDGHFVLYEDEGDNYNYEQGAFSTTCIRWQDEQRQLIFEERQGMYTGMNPHREFEVAIISEDEVSYVQKILYEGKKVIVDF